jgi:hypothetical protein
MKRKMMNNKVEISVTFELDSLPEDTDVVTLEEVILKAHNIRTGLFSVINEKIVVKKVSLRYLDQDAQRE